jgi:hypothetical protein
MNFANVPRDKRAFLLKLLLAEVIARPGEGPLAQRFHLPRIAPSPPERPAIQREGATNE